jgi:hypothetical protein
VKRHSNERHPLFYFISFINPHSPLTDIVIVHIVYMNETIPLPPSLVRRRRRRILLPCFANANPLPEAGNNSLGSECDHLPEAGNIYISIHSSAHPSAYSLWAPPKAANVAKLIRRRRISLKRDNHLKPIP